MEFYKCQEKKDVYSTWCSQAVTHLSTNHARRRLTSVIGRELVFSARYDRRQRIADISINKSQVKGVFSCSIRYLALLFTFVYERKIRDKHRKVNSCKAFDCQISGQEGFWLSFIWPFATVDVCV